MKRLNVKVCGQRDNVSEIQKVNPDFNGFIFYEKSSRYVGKDYEMADLKSGLKVGVFVDETFTRIAETAKKYQLDFVQLHSDQSIGFILNLRNLIPDVGIIKVFRVSNELPFDIDAYNKVADLFLFDTKVDEFGGSGKKFDWSILNSVRISTPFILAGGIGEEDLDTIKNLNLDYLYGVDLNSKFEESPGKKDIKKLESFIKSLRNE